uniref:Uncharacterized protein n=1 Tax=Nitrosopumivirus cobalaminus TaxID=3158414 RepID=A0AAU7N448_9VIRU
MIRYLFVSLLFALFLKSLLGLFNRRILRV